MSTDFCYTVNTAKKYYYSLVNSGTSQMIKDLIGIQNFQRKKRTFKLNYKLISFLNSRIPLKGGTRFQTNPVTFFIQMRQRSQ